MSDDCAFCGFETKRPELTVHQTARWVLAHVRMFFPVGSLFLVSRRHGLASEVTLAEWQEAAPLLAATTRMLMEVGRAERTYLAAFSEGNFHFHLHFTLKRAEHTAHHDGRRGPHLMAAMMDAAVPHDPAEVARTVERYRAALPRFLAAAGS